MSVYREWATRCCAVSSYVAVIMRESTARSKGDRRVDVAATNSLAPVPFVRQGRTGDGQGAAFRHPPRA